MYRKPMPRVLGEWAFSYERGAPVNVGGGDEAREPAADLDVVERRMKALRCPPHKQWSG